MRKAIIVLSIAGSTLITSCASGGWSCKSSYVKADKTKTVEKQKEV